MLTDKTVPRSYTTAARITSQSPTTKMGLLGLYADIKYYLGAALHITLFCLRLAEFTYWEVIRIQDEKRAETNRLDLRLASI
jgi:hypothetical protein